MAGRASVVLREQFEVAKRQCDLHGATTALCEVRDKVTLALEIATQRLHPIDAALARSEIAWLSGTYHGWMSERGLLRDEMQELKRLLDHIDSFNDAIGD